jgi:ribonuclease R
MTETEAPIQGIISVTRKGIGYIEIPGLPEDVEIPPEQINRAFNKDVVEIELLPKAPDTRQQGRVVRVVERSKTDFVGEIVEDKGKLYLEPDDRRVYTPFALGTATDHPTAQNGYKALIHMTEWLDDAKYPNAQIREIIGKKGEHETEMRAFVLAKGFELGFPADVMAEAREIDQTRDALFKRALDEITNGTRKDFRDVTTFTIDPADAKDFDDAISYKELPDGLIEVGIHIADVSFYVVPGSAIDTEARKRATSIYLVDRTIPMLPEVLSNDLCSLNPNLDRLATSAVFVLDKEGTVHSRWFGQGLIHSDKRFTYENAQEALKNPAGELHHELNVLDGVAKKMRAERARDGAISFEQDEIKFKLDPTGKPIGVYKKSRQDTNLLIEDFMLLANKEVAKHVTELNEKTEKENGKKGMFVYRIHDAPDPERIEVLAEFLKALGYELKAEGEEITAKEITALFKKVEGTPEEDLIKTATIRSMAKAIYSTENIGHFGLAFTHYTHFTSPIRRYPDVMVHRIMKSHEVGMKLSERELKDYERMVVQSTEREIAAAEAERDSIKYKQVEYLSQFVGKEFDGVVSGVADWGVYVEEPETKAEGLVRMRDLGNDFFVLDKSRYRVVGERTKKVFQLGDKVRIKLVGSNLEERTLDFVFVQG